MASDAQTQGVTVDRDGVIHQWSAEWEEAVGYSATEAIGHRVDLVVPPALRARHWQGFNKAIETGRTKRAGKPFNTVALHRSGRLVPLRATLDLTYADDGSPSGATGRVLGPGPSWMGPAARVLLAAMGVCNRRRDTSQAP